MMHYPITTNTILQHSTSEYSDVEIVSAQNNSDPLIYKYDSFASRVCQLANYLTSIGVCAGDRVATLAWNTHQHLELYYAISGIGAICHTINPRYSLEQISYIVDHAQDTALFFDLSFVDIAEHLLEKKCCIKHYVRLQPCEDNLPGNKDRFVDYESMLTGHDLQFEWPNLDEESEAALCYTSGTTGDPKGVAYSHRSIFLHATFASQRDALDISSVDTVCPIVPMFHVNAWGIPYIAPMAGATLVLPGSNLKAAALFELFETYKVTVTAGVPTILNALLSYMHEIGRKPASLHTIIIGGAAASTSMINDFEQNFGLRVLHGWGMTETSPLATISTPKPIVTATMSIEEQRAYKVKQGRKLFGVEIKLLDAQGNAVAHDGKSFGNLMIKGAWVVDHYYKDKHSALDKDGWFDTGDISTIDQNGYMQIVDRSKDVIKSGGEWISSVTLENAALQHPSIAQASVIGIADPKWLERPLMILVSKSDVETPSQKEIQNFLSEKVPKWWIPEKVIFVDSLPIGATGKVQKNELRAKFIANELIK